MLGFLFRTLTADRPRGVQLFDAATARAREAHWYIEGKVPDSLEGRFAVLTTVLALIFIRLEQEGPAGDPTAVGLTERFVDVMESEHRELGLGDPTLGKKVRKLVGALSARTDKWREVVMAGRDWSATARETLYKGDAPPAAVDHSRAALQKLWAALQAADLAALAEGRIE